MQSKLKLYNTLTREEEVFKPISSKIVGIYSCGPTVYSFQHIGNLRTYVFSDILKKTLQYNKFKVKHIINVTDVGHLTSDSDTGEDKIEKAAEKEHKTAKQISEFYFEEFKSDLKKLNIDMPNKFPKASEHIKAQIEIIKKLEKKHLTYKTSDGIYFNTSKLKDYGKLAKIDFSKIISGKRVSMGEKLNPTDFALWKFSSKEEERQQLWPSPWGSGFPGWHIECSAMSMKYLGEHFDIHTGGLEHIPVHHTNEIAQSESATEKKFVNFWLHAGWLLSQGKKVSKSKGGLYTISDLQSLGFSPLAFRYLCLQTHYKKPLNFSLDSLQSAENAYNKLKQSVIEIQEQTHKGNDLTKEYENQFIDAINDDLNMPRALKVLWDTINDFDFAPKKKLSLIKKFDSVLSLGISEFKEKKVSIPKEIKALIKAREEARTLKQYEKADILRSRIEEFGFQIKDTEQGAKVTKN